MQLSIQGEGNLVLCFLFFHNKSQYIITLYENVIFYLMGKLYRRLYDGRIVTCLHDTAQGVREHNAQVTHLYGLNSSWVTVLGRRVISIWLLVPIPHTWEGMVGALVSPPQYTSQQSWGQSVIGLDYWQNISPLEQGEAGKN